MKTSYSVALVALSVLTISPSKSAASDLLGQFDLPALSGLCASISTQQRAPDNPNEYYYAFEKKTFAAANVDFGKDNGASARLKLQSLWNTHPSEFLCQANDFDVRDGNVLKYAVETRSFSLIDDAIFWRLDLNLVDKSDGRTLLDYVDSKLSANSETSIGANLLAYRAKLVRAGALHSNHVPAAEVAAQKQALANDLKWHAARGNK